MNISVVGFEKLWFTPEGKTEEVKCTKVYYAVEISAKKGVGKKVESVNVHESKCPYDYFVSNGVGVYDISCDLKGKIQSVTWIGRPTNK